MSAASVPKPHRYGAEIKQMVRAKSHPVGPSSVALTVCEGKIKMFVFGEVKDPDDDVVRYVEDIVRDQVAELVSLSPFPLSLRFQYWF
jgi:Transcription initiation factor IID, 18kD subunit